MEDLSLSKFTSLDEVKALETYVSALEAFDGIPQLQDLKRIERALVRPSCSVLDVGCGFGLETERLARLAGPGTLVAGIDESAHFIAEAKRRSEAAGLQIDYRAGRAEALPYDDGEFSHVRAERLLIYLAGVRKAVAEMKRVLVPGGTLALIEPDFGSTTVNVEERGLVRRVMAHEADTAVKQSWLPGQLPPMLAALGLRDIQISTRVLIFPQALGETYFCSVAQNAADDGAITKSECETWQAEIADLGRSGRLFGTVGYFLFTATS